MSERVDIKHIVGFSGGVDSQACLWHVRQTYGDKNVIAINSDVGGHEHPITTKFVTDYSEKVFPVVQVTPLIRDLLGRGTRPGRTKDRRSEFSEDDVLTFDRLAYIKGRFPSRKMQFCTEHLKLIPQQRWINENIVAKGIEFERYAGVRCDESLRRKETPERIWSNDFKCWVNYPIRCWTKLECFAVLKMAGEEINPLYKTGFGRVGCAPCINSGKEDVRNWAARSPDMIDKVREWEKQLGVTFFAPCVPGMAINWVDDVVAWSKTARGGKQNLLPLVENESDIQACFSKYGLCE
jgi:3'-phosphoadenosine 5'-phosphosulfate sulfotransferase (PAPS reductase)/FAD synthetase